MAAHRSRLLAIIAVASALVVPGVALANENDPLLPADHDTYVWPVDFVGTYAFGDSFDIGWMKEAVRDGQRAIGHSSARNPDFHSVPETEPHNGHVKLLDPLQYDCDQTFRWKACADPYADRTFRLWFSKRECWVDASVARQCFLNPAAEDYDLQSAALNEWGHVNELGHHRPEVRHEGNADVYEDAVVQAFFDPYGYGHQFEVNRSLRWADRGRLLARYGPDPPPPCPPCYDGSDGS